MREHESICARVSVYWYIDAYRFEGKRRDGTNEGETNTEENVVLQQGVYFNDIPNK